MSPSTSPIVPVTDTFFTNHALERLREHFPRCGVRGACSLLAQALEIDSTISAALVGRADRADWSFYKNSSYFLSHDRRGIFVLVPARKPGQLPRSCVTYIRLDPPMQDEAERLFPCLTTNTPPSSNNDSNTGSCT